MKNKIINIVVYVLLLTATETVLAQQLEENDQNTKIQFGLKLSTGTTYLTQSGDAGYIDLNRESPPLLGFFVNSEKSEINIDFGFRYASAEFSHKIFNDFALQGGVNSGSYLGSTSRYKYSWSYTNFGDDFNVAQYYVGIGYHNTFWQRLKFQGQASIGGVSTNTAIAYSKNHSNYYYGYNHNYYSSYAPYGYGGYGYGDYRAPNKRIATTNTYKLRPTAIYGGEIYLELLPRKSKNRKMPLVPFFELSLMANNKSNIERSVKVEEWIPDNVVYEEKVKSSRSHNLHISQVNVGFKWYLKY